MVCIRYWAGIRCFVIAKGPARNSKDKYKRTRVPSGFIGNTKNMLRCMHNFHRNRIDGIYGTFSSTTTHTPRPTITGNTPTIAPYLDTAPPGTMRRRDCGDLTSHTHSLSRICNGVTRINHSCTLSCTVFALKAKEMCERGNHAQRQLRVRVILTTSNGHCE